MNLVQLKSKPVAPDSALRLRKLADQIESGECTSVVWAAAVNGEYQTCSGSSMTDSIVLSSILHDWSVRRIRGETMESE